MTCICWIFLSGLQKSPHADGEILYFTGLPYETLTNNSLLLKQKLKSWTMPVAGTAMPGLAKCKILGSKRDRKNACRVIHFDCCNDKIALVSGVSNQTQAPNCRISEFTQAPANRNRAVLFQLNSSFQGLNFFLNQ